MRRSRRRAPQGAASPRTRPSRMVIAPTSSLPVIATSDSPAGAATPLAMASSRMAPRSAGVARRMRQVMGGLLGVWGTPEPSLRGVTKRLRLRADALGAQQERLDY